MNPQQLSEAQKKFFEFQKELIETVTSDDSQIMISFNGMLEIVSLKIDTAKSYTEITPLLIATINKGIKNTSQKIQKQIMELQKNIQIPANK